MVRQYAANLVPQSSGSSVLVKFVGRHQVMFGLFCFQKRAPGNRSKFFDHFNVSGFLMAHGSGFHSCKGVAGTMSQRARFYSTGSGV